MKLLKLLTKRYVINRKSLVDEWNALKIYLQLPEIDLRDIHKEIYNHVMLHIFRKIIFNLMIVMHISKDKYKIKLNDFDLFAIFSAEISIFNS